MTNVKDLNQAFQALATSLKMPVGRKNHAWVVHSLRHVFETQACSWAKRNTGKWRGRAEA